MIAAAAQTPAIDEPRTWFTAAELAALALPGLPADKRAINRRARDEGWLLKLGADGAPLARARAGRGGGTEFHLSLLPPTARVELAQRDQATAEMSPAEAASSTRWQAFERRSARVKDEAARRLAIMSSIELLVDSGLTRTAAIAEAARAHTLSTATLWNWHRSIDGLDRSEWLPALAPRHQGGCAEAEIDPLVWHAFKSDFLRPSAPTLAACYARAAEIAAARGIAIPVQRTFARRIEREVPKSVLVLRRQGAEALRRMVPAQRRTVEHLHALEIVNIDGHKFDVRVTPPGGGDPVRPIMVAIQDIYSSKVLAWSLDLSENAIQTQLAFRDLFANYGLPRAVLLDNGRAFASKKITGGAKSRFRFKIKDDEPTGVLTALSINPMWALPYRGQSKPVERAFRDMCETIAKHPATEGAYVGNSPMNKPHNYGSRAMDWDAFVAHVARGIARHNAQTGRRGRHYAGRSFDQVFAESYAVAAIRKATPEHLRLALLTAQPRRVDRQTSTIELFGNRYWTPELSELAGERVMVRFDPEALHSAVEVYRLDGRYLAAAPVLEDTGFDSEAGAKASAKRLADFRRRTRELEEMEMLVAAQSVAELLPDPELPELPEPQVVRPVRHRGQTAAAIKSAPLAPSQHETRVFTALGKLRVVE